MNAEPLKERVPNATPGRIVRLCAQPWLTRLAWLPIPLLLLSMGLLWAADLRTVYEAPHLLMTLNFSFSTVVSAFVAHLIGRSFLVRGRPGLLMLGCGVVMWGAAGLVAVGAGLESAATGQEFANTVVTTHNLCVWLSALLQLAGAVLLLRPRRPLRTAGLWLASAYAGSLGAVGLVTLSVLDGRTPTFFVQGQGGTPLRQAVLASAIAMFALTAITLRWVNRKSLSLFVYWYALALVLIAAGLLGVMNEPAHGSPLSWAGRAAQFLGGAYMLIAAIASVRESRVWGISLEAALSEARERFAELFNLAADGMLVREIGSDPAGGRFIHANPAICALLGYTPQELGVLHPLDIIAPEDRPDAAHDMDAMSRDRVLRHEKTLIAKDGRRIPAEISSRFFRHQGRPTVMSVIRDITERRRAAEALRQERDFVSAVLDTAGALVVVLDGQGRITRFNRACEHVTGYTAAQVLGRVFWEFLIPPEELAGVKQTWSALKTGDFPNAHENHWLTRDGSRRLIAWSNTVLTGPVGEVQHVIATGIDITERKRAEEALRQSEARFKVIASSTPDHLLVQDRDLRYTLVINPQLGLTEQDMIGKTDHDFLAREDADNLTRIKRQVVETGQSVHVEAPALSRTGQQEFFDGFYVPKFNAEGQVDGLIGYFRNVTDRKRMDEELKALNETLEQRVAERTAEAEARAAQLQRLAAELTQAEQKERQRLAEVLHDHLQQLLVGAKFNLGILRGQTRNTQLRQSIEHVDDLLDQSLATSRSLTVELCPPVLREGDFAQVLYWLARWARDKHGLTVEVQVDEQANPAAEEIRVLLFQAVRELLLNVRKHAKVEHARLQMNLCGADQVEIIVADDGVGFDVSGQLQDSSGLSGSGFGLFSIRERVGLMRGTCQVDSSPGRGTRIRLLVPLSTAAAPGVAETSQVSQPRVADRDLSVGPLPAPQDNQTIRVLLADDHAVVRDGLARLLQLHPDIQVAGQAENGQQAVEMALRLRPDVIVMDVSMPHMSGVEATRRIMRDLPAVKVIGLSMHLEEDVAAQMKAAGAVAYLTKSMPPETLVAAIRECTASPV
jgi:PAS domain S-box-containing protein